MTEVENNADISTMPETSKTIAQAKEVLNDEKFIIQKGLRSLVDKDARVGYKSKTDNFYGYKIEFTMIPEERIITAVETCDGAYVDGNKFDELYNRSKEWKNGEMKRFHGLDRARGYGLKSMSMQAKLTALAVNLKRIAALVSFLFEYLLLIFGESTQLRIIENKNLLTT